MGELFAASDEGSYRLLKDKSEYLEAENVCLRAEIEALKATHSNDFEITISIQKIAAVILLSWLITMLMKFLF